MKRLFMIIALMAGTMAFAGNNPTNPNSSYKNQYPKGGKGTTEIRKDQVERNYKKQGVLEVNAPVNGNVKKAGKINRNYKAPFGL